ncbi:MAG: dimethylmenaquinone methyltransferase [Beijerinckiaceae bacterium]
MATRVHPVPSPLPAGTLDQWAGVVSTIAIDCVPGAIMLDPALRPLRSFGDRKPLVGRVITARVDPFDFGAMVHVTEAAGEGDVIVLDAGGRNTDAVAGEIICGQMRRRGVRGIVVDGAVRDTDNLLWPDFAVFYRHIVARGPKTFEAGEVNHALSLGGAVVTPGDLLIGDDDGLVVIPREKIAAGLAPALAKPAIEKAWEDALASGKSPSEVFLNRRP